MTQYIDTYSNLRKAEPVFYRKDGRLTAYGLHCGYVETFKTDSGNTVSLYCEHQHYHVKKFIRNVRYEWEVFELVNEAWTMFFRFKSELLAIPEKPHHKPSFLHTGQPLNLPVYHVVLEADDCYLHFHVRAASKHHALYQVMAYEEFAPVSAITKNELL